MERPNRIMGRPGASDRPGLTAGADGITFATAAPEKSRVRLVLLDGQGKKLGAADLPENPETGEVRSFVVEEKLPPDFGYYYEIDGKKTADPFARSIRGGVCAPADDSFDWAGDALPELSPGDVVIYKLHVRGFTKKAPVPAAHRGTFAGLTDRIAYLKALGVTAVELMPVYDFDEALHIRPYAPVGAGTEGRKRAHEAGNYWGYAAQNHYFAPKESYGAGNASTELKRAVAAFHREGMEVYLEMYFPGDADPAEAYGAVRAWKKDYHIDGFHCIGDGVPVALLVRDPYLKRTKLFFERIDAGWMFRGEIPERRNVIEYNEDFQRTGRLFLKGTEGQTSAFAQQLRRNSSTHACVNYMANVNGFTLWDSVCYEQKHNEANGEGNQDGPSDNFTWNCGVEGPSRKKQVRQLRLRQVRNAILYTFFAQGIPLIYAGDEQLNSQGGNNNAYAADNAVGWVDWSSSADAEEMRAFVARAAAFRRAHPILRMPRELRGSDYRSVNYPDISFHAGSAWSGPFDLPSRTLAILYCGMYTQTEEQEPDDFVYVAYNAHWESFDFALPALPPGFRWTVEMDTADLSAGGLLPEGEKFIRAGARSVVVLTGRAGKENGGAKKKRSDAKKKRDGAKESLGEEKRGGAKEP